MSMKILNSVVTSLRHLPQVLVRGDNVVAVYKYKPTPLAVIHQGQGQGQPSRLHSGLPSKGGGYSKKPNSSSYS